MANVYIQGYLNDSSIPLEKRQNILNALKAGQDEEQLADIIKTKFNEYKQTNKSSLVGANFAKTLEAQTSFENVDISRIPEGVDPNVWGALDEAGKRGMAVNWAKLQEKAPGKVQELSEKQKQAGQKIAGQKFIPMLGKNIVGAASGAIGGIGKGLTKTLGGLTTLSEHLPWVPKYSKIAEMAKEKGIEMKTPGEQIKESGESFAGLMRAGGRVAGADEAAISGGEFVGETGEQIAEFLLPASKISKASKAAEAATAGSKLFAKTPGIVQKGAGLLAKSGVEAAAYGGISAAQEGEINKNVITTAVISGALPVLGKVGQKVGEYIKAKRMKAASNIIAKLIKPNKNAYTFGKDPNLAVAKYVKTAKSWDDLVTNINKATKEAGSSIDDVVKKAGSNKTTSVRDLIAKNLDDFKLKNADTATQKTYMQKINDLVNISEPNLKKGTIEVVGKLNIDKMNAKELWGFQKKLGSLTQWTGAVGENAANKSLHKLYNEVGRKLDKLAPGTKGAQFKYANLIGAQKAIEARAAVATRNTGILTSMIGGSAGASIAGATGGKPEDYIKYALAGIIGPRIYNSPIFRTSLAKILAKEGVINTSSVVGSVIKELPAISKAVLQEQITHLHLEKEENFSSNIKQKLL